LDLIEKGCRKLVADCGGLKPGERALIVSDETTRPLGLLLEDAARRITDNVTHHTIPALKTHGQEPPLPTARAMLKNDVIFCMTHMSMAHTKARLAGSERGARYLSLPEYSFDLLKNSALHADFRSLTAISNRLAKLLTAGNEIALRSKLGTELFCSIKGRVANAAPGWCDGPGKIASPPDAETNITILEDSSRGLLVVDGSIPYPGLGLLARPIKFVVEKGIISNIDGEKKEERLLRDLLWTGVESKKKRTLAELGIGLNPEAKLCGMMLIDEGTRGTVHIGLGSNSTIGGKNNVSFHLDLVISAPNLELDGKMILKDGEFLCGPKLRN